MPESYLELSTSDQKDILQTAAAELGRSEAILEKDIWVCWVLQTLFNLPDAHTHMAFKGGTSLSKVYQVIDRFSEDVDITIDYRHFDDIDYKDYPEVFNPFADNASKNQIRKFSNRLKGYVKGHTHDILIPHLFVELDKIPTAKSHNIRHDDLGEKVWLSYPSVVESQDEYLKTEVLIELGGRNVIDPNEKHYIEPYMAEITQSVSYPGGNVTVLSPERTFWEKATLVHVECNRESIKNDPERLSRHWYDLTMLAKHSSGKTAIHNRKLFEDVVRHKKAFFDASYANYDACLAGEIKLLPATDTISSLKSDYENMLKAGMIYQDPPSFDQIISSISIIEKEINKW